MAEHAGQQGQDALAQAQSTIADLEAQIRRLRGQLDDEQLASDLRRAFTLASTSGTIAAPVSSSDLLEMIVQVAADVISARAGSLFLIDHERQDLVFEVAIGPKAQAVEKFRVPLGHGVAGIVALTGQAMAVSDVQSDPRHASDISQSVGYLPESLLCVPLFYEDQIIGVLELLDKDGASSFGPRDIDHLGLFANLAAVAIEQSRVQRDLVTMIGTVLSSFDGLGGDQAGLLERARLRAQAVQEEASYQQTLEIASLVEEIAHQGEEEREAVRAILLGFAGYLRKRQDAAALLGMMS